MADIAASLTGSQPDLDVTALSDDTLERSAISEDWDLSTESLNPFASMQNPNAMPLYHGLYITAKDDAQSVNKEERSEVKVMEANSDVAVECRSRWPDQLRGDSSLTDTLEVAQA